ncbi:MAG TPA: hypothetical protein VD865_05910 [Stenotrophomonas sp.]|nr:hypothetical protein [Stenotrophomonas sp.]
MPRWMRRLVYAVFGVCAGSGVLWLVYRYAVPYRDAFGPAPHPLLRHWLALHGASALGMAAILGLLWLPHVRPGWRNRRNHRSGSVLLASLLVLAASGWGLYYLGNEGVRAWLASAHWILGLGVIIALPWHVWRGRRRARLNPSPRTPAPSPSPAHPRGRSAPGNNADAGQSR